MITESMELQSKSDARLWAAQYDLSDDQTERLAGWIWANKPFIGCTINDHPLYAISDENFWDIIEPAEE